MPQCVWGKINVWGREGAATWDRGTATTPEWLRVVSVSKQVTQASQSIQTQ